MDKQSKIPLKECADDEVDRSSQSPSEDGGGFSIYSWNINGMRTISMREVLQREIGGRCDILAVQETKLSRSQLEHSQAIVEDYTSYFSFSRNRQGYSGVATYCSSSSTPSKAEEGVSGATLDTGVKSLETAIGGYCDVQDEDYNNAKYGDNDGRIVVTEHTVELPDGSRRPLNVINVYCPRLRDDPSDPVNNREFKLTFHNLLSERARNLVKRGHFVALVGDLNVSRTIIDQSDVDDPKQFMKTDFRRWLNDFLEEGSENEFKDTFRVLHPDAKHSFTCWNTRLNARQNNFGSRIDYIIVDSHLAAYLRTAVIHKEIMGSDHCPVSATFNLKLKPSHIIPKFASKYFPELCGKQQSLLEMFRKQDTSTAQQGKNVFSANSNTPANKSVKRTSKQTSLTAFIVKKPKLEPDSNHSLSNRQEVIPTTSSTDIRVSTVATSVPEDDGAFQVINIQASEAWRQLLKGREAPLCGGHNDKCVIRTVTKKGVHRGRQFWACPRGVGRPGDPSSNCNFFKWASSTT